MKSRIFTFSLLACLLGVLPVNASDCIGQGCSETQQKVTKPAPLPDVINSQDPTVWDGEQKNYIYPGFDKTVDWRDGVPIWDDSISTYKYNDFRDWPIYGPVGMDCLNQSNNDIEYPNDVSINTQNFGDGSYEITCGVNIDPEEVNGIKQSVSNIRDQIEELLVPLRPQLNMWASAPEQDLSNAIQIAFEEDSDGCPFETESECDIWRKKPMVRETVSPRSPKIRQTLMNNFIVAASTNKNINANDSVAAPLLERYKMLMQSAQACCTDGMVYELKRAGATDGLVYKFLADDANFYNIGDRCLMLNDNDLDKKYANTATAAVAADVRNGCLCRGKQWFNAMLAPFQEAYSAVPEFADARFNYKYKDGLKREITVSVNTDVKNVLHQLSLCP